LAIGIVSLSASFRATCGQKSAFAPPNRFPLFQKQIRIKLTA
jgi:hypothetical protein